MTDLTFGSPALRRTPPDSRGLARHAYLLGCSRAFLAVLEQARIYGEYYLETVYIRGEVGTGKSALGHYLHMMGPRRDKTFVHYDCGHLHETLADTELFGHKKGAFTGATHDHMGIIEAANGGSLLLDEIGNLPPGLQTKFLHVLQERTIRSLGACRPLLVDVRFILASNRDLESGVREGWFREDLYSRITVLVVEVPPLREREDDAVTLAEHRVEQLNAQYGRTRRLASDVPPALLAYRWPQNVRELFNAVTRAYVHSTEATIPLALFPPAISEGGSDQGNGNGNGHGHGVPASARIDDLVHRIDTGSCDFWRDLRPAYLQRDLSRAELVQIITYGLRQSGGRYTILSTRLNCDYDRFMAFLRHHQLKPRKAKQVPFPA